MQRPVRRLAVMAILGLVLAGCGQREDPVRVVPPAMVPSAPVFQVVTGPSGFVISGSTTLAGYTVSFDGRFVANDQTTFSYTVSGTGATNALSHFVLELPGCAPDLDSFSPGGGIIGPDPITGLYGIKWDISLGVAESRTYSITFPGDVALGAIRTTVKAGTASPVGEVAGPCGGFAIAGTVYADADGSGALEGPDETGIGNVTVTIVDANDAVLSATTDANGGYGFIRAAGTYTLRVDAATAEADFNEVLAANFDPTGTTPISVTVGPSSTGNDFGFAPRVQQITQDVVTGQLLTTGEGPKFWIMQLRGGPKAEFDADMMAAFLDEIEGLFLPYPFQFTDGAETRDAIQILRSQSKDPLEQLLKELLAAELNEVSGKGLVGAAELQEVMLAWVESLFVEASSPAGPGAAAAREGYGPRRAVGDASLKDAVKFLEALNGATGGGGAGGEG